MEFETLLNHVSTFDPNATRTGDMPLMGSLIKQRVAEKTKEDEIVKKHRELRAAEVARDVLKSFCLYMYRSGQSEYCADFAEALQTIPFIWISMPDVPWGFVLNKMKELAPLEGLAIKYRNDVDDYLHDEVRDTMTDYHGINIHISCI